MSVYLSVLLLFLGVSIFFFIFCLFNGGVQGLLETIKNNIKQTAFLLFIAFILFSMWEHDKIVYAIGYVVTLIIPISFLFELLNDPLHRKIKDLEDENERLKQAIKETSEREDYWKNKYYEEDDYEDRENR